MALVKRILNRLFNPALRPILLGNAGAPLRTLFLVDDPGATMNISFELPLKTAFARGERSGLVFPQPYVKKMVEKNRSKSILKHIEKYDPQTIVFSRYGGPLYDEILTWAKNQKVKIIFHIDDNLFEFPADFPAAKNTAHLAPEVIQCRETIVKNADLVYCSTGPLEAYMAKRFSPKQTFSGIYCPYPGVGEPKTLNNSKIFGYMGTRSHLRDLKTVLPLIVGFLQDHPDWKFEVIGDLQALDWPATVKSQIIFSPPVRPYAAFRKMLSSKKWVAGLAPLVSDEFNRFKASTKFVEYTVMGAVTIATDIDPYHPALAASAAVNLAGLDKDRLYKLFSDRQRLESIHKSARTFCESTYATEILTRQVQKVLEPHATQ